MKFIPQVEIISLWSQNKKQGSTCGRKAFMAEKKTEMKSNQKELKIN